VIEYATDLFTAATIDTLFTRWVHLLESVATDPDMPISSIDLLFPEERHQLLIDYNNTTIPISPTCLPVLFEQQVTRTPNNTAVIFGDTTLTYAQLNTAANQLAHLMIAHDVGPEQLVALALPRSSVELVVSVLAVLKTGAAYLPLDPDYPPARIEFMLTDAQPALLLTTPHTQDRLPANTVSAPLVIDDPGTVAALKTCPDTNPTNTDRIRPLLPQHPAYVIYTSGSTGTPKGVTTSHTGVANLVSWAVSSFGRAGLSRVLASTSLNFDVSVFEMFGPLACGGSLELVPNLLALTERSDTGW